MRSAPREWVEKSEADFVSAGREYRARKQPNYDAACFFAQQCVEKYLKARLVQAKRAVPKTHDRSSLLDCVLPLEPLWEVFRPKLETLTSFAVAFRYPGESATREIAKAAVADARMIRARIRQALRLSEK